MRFRGARELIGLIDQVSSRRSPSPILSLTRTAEHRDVLAAIDQYLRSPESRPVRHAYLDLDSSSTPNGVEAVGEILSRASTELGRSRKRRDRLHFRHFTLVTSLMNGTVPPGSFALRMSRPYRWLLRQPYLAPASGAFLDLAERLSPGEWQREPPAYLARLLVHAFLEDVRRARRGHSGPVLLLDNVSSANGGHLLLRLINDVRNETGLADPLLVIGAGGEPPGHEGEPPSASYAEHAYLTWLLRLRDERSRRSDTAWYLPIRIPDSEYADEWPTFHNRLPKPRWTGRTPLSLALCVVISVVLADVVARMNAVEITAYAAIPLGLLAAVAAVVLLMRRPRRTRGREADIADRVATRALGTSLTALERLFIRLGPPPAEDDPRRLRGVRP